MTKQVFDGLRPSSSVIYDSFNGSWTIIDKKVISLGQPPDHKYLISDPLGHQRWIRLLSNCIYDFDTNEEIHALNEEGVRVKV